MSTEKMEKHFLVVHSQQESNRYLPLLKKNMGEGNYDIAVSDTPDYDDDELEDDFDWYDAVDRIKTRKSQRTYLYRQNRRWH